MRERAMGIENEYAFAAAATDGKPFDRGDALRLVGQRLRKRFPHLPSVNGGIFVCNGGRFYIDSGRHQEWCTPESACPWTVVRHLLAGEKMLADSAEDLVRGGELGSAVFSKCNVDYSDDQTSWGAHESYQHTRDPAELPRDMVPFLASRVIFTGAGGFDPAAPAGCTFVLSPRASLIGATVSDSSTHDRGIFHTKDEPLASRGHRLHVLVGESLCSRVGNWLKLTTTTLCLAMAEAGSQPGAAVALASPVQALRTFAADPTCRATARGADGRDLTALAIQRHYLELARRHVGTRAFPDWAGQAVEEWDAVLRKLERAPAGVADCLDWGIKLAVFRSCARRAGFSWDAVGWWGHVHSILHRCAAALPGDRPPEVTGKLVLASQSPLRHVVRELTPHLAERGLAWERFEAFLALRLQLFEADLRFGQLGEGGIFTALDRAGVLRHAFPGIDRIEEAMTQPPASGRARRRSRVIGRFKAQPDRFECYWDRVIDNEKHRALDLGEPCRSG